METHAPVFPVPGTRRYGLLTLSTPPTQNSFEKSSRSAIEYGASPALQRAGTAVEAGLNTHPPPVEGEGRTRGTAAEASGRTVARSERTSMARDGGIEGKIEAVEEKKA